MRKQRICFDGAAKRRVNWELRGPIERDWSRCTLSVTWTVRHLNPMLSNNGSQSLERPSAPHEHVRFMLTRNSVVILESQSGSVPLIQRSTALKSTRANERSALMSIFVFLKFGHVEYLDVTEADLANSYSL